MLLDKNARELIKVAAHGIDEEAWKPRGRNMTTTPFSEPKMLSDLKYPDSQYGSGLRLFSQRIRLLPRRTLIAQDKVLGILSFIADTSATIGMKKLIFAYLAGQAAGAIQNSQLYEQTKQQAIDLEKANKVKDEFLGVMSHELRTPLNVIAGYTKIVQDGVLGEINAEQVNALDKVTRHSNEL